MPTPGGGIVVTIHCNHCGRRFESAEHHLRFCSISCSSRFWAPTRRHRPTALYAPSQAALLDCLRQHPGEWVERGEIARAVYGVDDPSTQYCIRMTLNRLRGTWAGDGLVIASRRDAPRLHRNGSTYYRLESDIDADEEELTG